MPVQFAFGNAGDLSKGGMVPVLLLNSEMVSETIAPSGSSQPTTAAAPAIGNNPVCVISNTESAAVYVAIGTTPIATTTTATETSSARLLIPAGVMFGVGCRAGDKAAVVNA